MIDQRPETYKHIGHVRQVLTLVVGKLLQRMLDHDASKLESPERECFDEVTPKLAGMTYGSDEYKGCLAAMKPALDHHYAGNRHHPEYFRWHCCVCNRSFSDEQAPISDWGDGSQHRFCPTCVGGGSVIWEAELIESTKYGLSGMTLVDLVEMLCDWKAATLRHADGDIRKSIEGNQKRFGYSDELKQIMLNTLEVIEQVKVTPGVKP
jgi:hypothetical protein